MCESENSSVPPSQEGATVGDAVEAPTPTPATPEGETHSLEDVRRGLQNRTATWIFLATFAFALFTLAATLAEFWFFGVNEGGVAIGRCAFTESLGVGLGEYVKVALLAIVSHGALVISSDFGNLKLWKIVVWGSLAGVALSFVTLQMLSAGDGATNDFASSIAYASCPFSSFYGAEVKAKGALLMHGYLVWFATLLISYGLAGQAAAAASRVQIRETYLQSIKDKIGGVLGV